MRSLRSGSGLLLVFWMIPLVCGCAEGSRSPAGPLPDYERGRIILSFVEGTLKPKAQALIVSYGLPIRSWSPVDFTYANVRVLQGNRAEYIPRLQAHPQIASVEIVAGTVDQLQLLFYAFPSLHILRYHFLVNELQNQPECHNSPMKQLH